VFALVIGLLLVVSGRNAKAVDPLQGTELSWKDSGNFQFFTRSRCEKEFGENLVGDSITIYIKDRCYP
jgi:hypothetical protein